MNTPKNSEDLRAIYHLSLDDIERFDVTYANNPLARTMIEDSASVGARLALGIRNNRCLSLGILAQLHTIHAPDACKMEELPSVARYLCMRTEQRVAELDAAR